MAKNLKKMKLIIYDSTTTLLLLVCAILASYVLVIITHNNNIVNVLFILAVILISKFTTGYIYGIIAALFSATTGIHLFTYPYTHYVPPENETTAINLLILVIFLFLSIMASYMKISAMEAKERELKNKRKNELLNEINTNLLSANGLSFIINLSLEYISDYIKSTVVFYSKSPQSGDRGIFKSIKPVHVRILNSRHEYFIAHWVFKNMIPAGVGTDFCGESSCIYLPLISHNVIWGVIGVYCSSQKPLDESKLNFLNIVTSQVAMSIERQHLTDNQQLIMIETEKEKMRANLLRAVSHDLRTPLTGMIGVSETLKENKNFLSEEEKDRLIGDIHEDSIWLLHMVENLLTVTRIHEEDSSVKKIPEPLEEVVSDAIMRVKKRYPKTQIHVKVPEDFLMVPMDATLIEQVIMNLIENALKHSQSAMPIDFIVTKEKNEIFFHIIDQGIGISEDRLDAVFDGYSQTQNRSSDSSKGIGIGLSICKAIINAHGGTISATNHTGGGARFTFTLPL